MSRNISFGINEFYHTYNRGTEKRLIFLDQNDQNRFLNLLFFANSSNPINLRKNHHRGRGQASAPFEGAFDQEKRGETLIDIGAYCLMPNHFHLLVREKTEGGLSKLMHKLLTSYSMYFNRRHKRTGALFESRFKAKHADDDGYLHYLFAYIHLNPIKIATPTWPNASLTEINAAQDFLKNYAFSSYPDYIGINRPEKLILNREVFPDYFQTPKDFSALIRDWMLYRAEEGENAQE